MNYDIIKIITEELRKVLENKNINPDIQYFSVVYDTLSFVEKVANSYKYEEKIITPVLLLNPNLVQVYSQQDFISYDGNISIIFMVDQRIASECLDTINALSQEMNGLFVEYDNYAIKLKSSMAIEQANLVASGSKYTPVFMNLGVHISSIIMGDQIKYSLVNVLNQNEIEIRDIDRNEISATELITDTIEGKGLFSNVVIGNIIKETFIVPLDFSRTLTTLLLDGRLVGEVRDYNLKIDFNNGLRTELFSGKITNINLISQKGREATISFYFDVDEVLNE